MQCIHKNDYNISEALTSLLPEGGPVLCRDEMEEWSPSEANLFEEALEKYGKDFRDIQQDFVSFCYFILTNRCYVIKPLLERFVMQTSVPNV